MIKIKKFQVKQSSKNGQWHAVIIGLNGEPIFSSEQHPDQRNSLHACELVDPKRQFPIEVIDAEGNLRLIPAKQPAQQL